MGNAACLDRFALCGPKEAHKFLPPNADGAFYTFDHVTRSELWEGATSSRASAGYPLDSRWENLCHGTSKGKLCVSGRLHIECASEASQPPGLPVFRLCSRGRRHGEVMTGIHFALVLKAAGSGLLLCPYISVMLTNGEEVGLVGDALGPVPLQDLLVDFAVVDQGGHNLQMDIILRGLPTREAIKKPYDWTLRTCLQEFTTFNDTEKKKQIYLAASADAACQVHLQNLVASDEEFRTRPANPIRLWMESKSLCDQGTILFEGISDTLVVGMDEDNNVTARSSGIEDFWHHSVFDIAHGRASPSGGLETTQGEFWMSKRAMNMQPLFVYCQLTLAQAMVSCISLRFSCQMDYLNMLQRNTQTTLQFKYPHIPSRGVIMGVEQDPRNPRLVRMFIEYRNEILEDMILCEIDDVQAEQILVQQEIYDTIGMLRYRVVIHHPDEQLYGELRVKNQRLEEIDHTPSRSLQFFEEPSWRFPIAPLASRMATSAGSRLFLYTGVPYSEAALATQASPDTSADGMLQKPGSKVVWRHPMVESVAVVNDAMSSRWG